MCVRLHRCMLRKWAKRIAERQKLVRKVGQWVNGGEEKEKKGRVAQTWKRRNGLSTTLDSDLRGFLHLTCRNFLIV